MKEIQPFIAKSKCPKCIVRELGMIPQVKFCWSSDGREYLRVTCGSCGYTWNMETADANKKE